MGTPWFPLPLAQLQANYLGALVRVYDQRAVDAGAADDPGAAHVFDCEDGLRLVVMRERTEDGWIAIHLSAGLGAPGELSTWLDARPAGMRAQTFLAVAVARWREISGDTRTPMTLAGTSASGVPHWFGFPQS